MKLDLNLRALYFSQTMSLPFMTTN